jgi:hypothetical protein
MTNGVVNSASATGVSGTLSTDCGGVHPWGKTSFARVREREAEVILTAFDKEK